LLTFELVVNELVGKACQLIGFSLFSGTGAAAFFAQ